MNRLFKKNILYSMITVILISLSITGSDCDKSTGETTNGVPNELLGDWKLASQTGALQDICPDETINYQSSKVAQLVCPGGSPVSRDFDISDNILTYTQTSVEYDVEFSNNNSNLALYGRNVSRNLFYEKIITSSVPNTGNEKTNFNNSSELKK